jgi:hypothetical protein
VSSVLSQQILQHNIVEHRIRQQAFELGVLIFKRFQAVGVRQFCPFRPSGWQTGHGAVP